MLSFLSRALPESCDSLCLPLEVFFFFRGISLPSSVVIFLLRFSGTAAILALLGFLHRL